MGRGDEGHGREERSEILVESSEPDLVSEMEEEEGSYREVMRLGNGARVEVKGGDGFVQIVGGDQVTDQISCLEGGCACGGNCGATDNCPTTVAYSEAAQLRESEEGSCSCGGGCAAHDICPSEVCGEQVRPVSMPEGELDYADEGEVTSVTEGGYAQDKEADTDARVSIAFSDNSFDQVAREIAKDLDDFDHMANSELRHLAAHIPERNGDRLLSEEPSVMQRGAEVRGQEEEHYQNLHAEHSEHDHMQYMQGHHQQGENHRTEHNNDQMVQHHYEEDDKHNQHDHHSEQHVDRHLHENPHDGGEEQDVPVNVERTIQGSDYASHANENDNVSDDGMPGPPPSFIFRTERMSKNVAEAMANIWDRFWAEDMRQIVQIIKNRFSQLMPYIRRFLAHLVAFWGGINYIRRALTAFVRILNRDERVRELLQRIGWASSTTVRVFLSICAMVMQATLQMYYLIRDRIIPDTRRVVPILYYKAILKLLMAAERSPWSLVLGPFSLTFAIDANKLPDPYFLHNKLSVPHDDVTFENGGVQSIVQSVKETLHRSRAMYGSHISTPVHSQTTDEEPFPPPSHYSMSKAGDGVHHRHKHSKRNVEKKTEPLAERTNCALSS